VAGFNANFHDKQIIFRYTINIDEIPMPFSGEYYDSSCKIKLTKEFIHSFCKGSTRIDFKVIAVTMGAIPSEVA
jgi:hypothetical protein